MTKIYILFMASKDTYKSWFISEEKWPIGEQIREHAEIVLAELDNLILAVNANAVSLSFLKALQTDNHHVIHRKARTKVKKIELK